MPQHVGMNVEVNCFRGMHPHTENDVVIKGCSYTETPLGFSLGSVSLTESPLAIDFNSRGGFSYYVSYFAFNALSVIMISPAYVVLKCT